MSRYIHTESHSTSEWGYDGILHEMGLAPYPIIQGVSLGAGGIQGWLRAYLDTGQCLTLGRECVHDVPGGSRGCSEESPLDGWRYGISLDTGAEMTLIPGMRS